MKLTFDYLLSLCLKRTIKTDKKQELELVVLEPPSLEISKEEEKKEISIYDKARLFLAQQNRTNVNTINNEKKEASVEILPTIEEEASKTFNDEIKTIPDSVSGALDVAPSLLDSKEGVTTAATLEEPLEAIVEPITETVIKEETEKPDNSIEDSIEDNKVESLVTNEDPSDDLIIDETNSISIEENKEVETILEGEDGFPLDYPEELKNLKSCSNADLLKFFSITLGYEEYNAAQRQLEYENINQENKSVKEYKEQINNISTGLLGTYSGTDSMWLAFSDAHINCKSKYAFNKKLVKIPIYHFDEKNVNNVYMNYITLHISQTGTRGFGEKAKTQIISKLENDVWEKTTNLPEYEFYFFSQNLNKINELAKTQAPYAISFFEENEIGGKYSQIKDVRLLLLAPYMESFYKAGYMFAESYFKRSDNYRRGYLERFIRFSLDFDRVNLDIGKIVDKDIKGKLHKRFIDLTKPYLQYAKDNDKTRAEDLLYLQIFCKAGMSIFQFVELLNYLKESITQSYMLTYNQVHFEDYTYFRIEADVERVSKNFASLLRLKKPNGNPYFTFDSLLTLLKRIERYEALSPSEATNEISDYIRMCEELNVKPRFDTDSLAREHKIAVKNYNAYMLLNNTNNGEFDEAVKELQKFNYTEKDSPYFIRSLTSVSDLYDEASQQGNCLASYLSDIKNKRSYIFVMRTKEEPQKSLISLEIDPKDKKIKQQYLAHNNRISQDSQLAFLERFEKHFVDVSTNVTNPIILPEALIERSLSGKEQEEIDRLKVIEGAFAENEVRLNV